MKLFRYPGDPILRPTYSWEESGVFNAGTIYHNWLFYLLYKAVYRENRSNIGYAISRDGFHFFKLDKPVFENTEDFETFRAEDPRITRIGDTFYIPIQHTQIREQEYLLQIPRSL